MDCIPSRRCPESVMREKTFFGVLAEVPLSQMLYSHVRESMQIVSFAEHRIA